MAQLKDRLQHTDGPQNISEAKHIQTIVRGTLNKIDPLNGCGNCQASCQSACKTSCTVGNQLCERLNA